MLEWRRVLGSTAAVISSLSAKAPDSSEREHPFDLSEAALVGLLKAGTTPSSEESRPSAAIMSTVHHFGLACTCQLRNPSGQGASMAS